jgi:LysM repeat protein
MKVNNQAKLSPEQRAEILVKLESGTTAYKIAKEYGVSPNAIYQLRDKDAAPKLVKEHVSVKIDAERRPTALNVPAELWDRLARWALVRLLDPTTKGLVDSDIELADEVLTAMGRGAR